MEVKTFSEIMAEKRLKRQQEKELQQQNKGQGQKEENGSEESARKRKFRYQPVLFSGDGVGEELHVCVGVGMKRLSERESSTTSLFCSVMMMEVKRTLERGSSTASLFSGDGVGEVLCVCERERGNGCEEITRKRKFHCRPVFGLC